MSLICLSPVLAYERAKHPDEMEALFLHCRENAAGLMKTILIFLAAMLVWLLPAIVQASEMAQCVGGNDGIRLEMTIEGVRNDKGSITVTVYGDRPEDFLAKGKKLSRVRLPASPGTVRGCVMLPKEGLYAVAAYHDEDGDRRFTRTLIGLPDEGYAFSNDPALVLGAPPFAAVAFAASARVTPLHLRMHYP